ncbi:MAG: NapC/NirT family cytochrome c [Candidatus Eiseniibacteriota bacterium]
MDPIPASFPAALPAAIAVTLAFLVTLRARPQLTRQASGKVLAFFALFGLPAVCLSLGLAQHMEHAKKREFCLSCHVMEPYGNSLYVDDEEFVPAVHFQDRLVPRDKACYTCHTTYGPFGDARAKLRGLRHLYVQYLGQVPDTIRLYEPFHNRECLHCHGGARQYMEVEAHRDPDTLFASIAANRTSCLTSGCHDVGHNVSELGEVTFWKEPRP